MPGKQAEFSNLFRLFVCLFVYFATTTDIAVLHTTHSDLVSPEELLALQGQWFV
jgi:hypothetical protein